jgi:HAD superfamily hydrolase (TIGR01549 family)
MIKAVCFDLDDTLFDYRGFMAGCEDYLCELASDLLGVAPPKCRRIYRKAKGNLYRDRPLDPAIFDWGERISTLVSALGFEPEDTMIEWLRSNFWQRFISVIEPYPDSKPVLEALRESGRKTAVVSNGIRKVERLGLSGLFDVDVYSSDVAVNKPAPGIFRRCLTELGTSAEDSLMVGDLTYVDVKGAKAVGMRTCWFRSGAHASIEPSDASEEADLVVSRLSELSRAMEIF